MLNLKNNNPNTKQTQDRHNINRMTQGKKAEETDDYTIQVKDPETLKREYLENIRKQRMKNSGKSSNTISVFPKMDDKEKESKKDNNDMNGNKGEVTEEDSSNDEEDTNNALFKSNTNKIKISAISDKINKPHLSSWSKEEKEKIKKLTEGHPFTGKNKFLHILGELSHLPLVNDDIQGMRKDIHNSLNHNTRYTMTREYDLKLVSDYIHSLDLNPLNKTEIMTIISNVYDNGITEFIDMIFNLELAAIVKNSRN